VLEATAYRPADMPDPRARHRRGRPLDFHTPYGCSKGARTSMCWIMRAALACHRGAADELHLRASAKWAPKTRAGSRISSFVQSEPASRSPLRRRHQVRDILDVADAVDAYLAAWRSIDAISGRPST
jgi:CDP-paratose 2-epimerase